MLVPISWLKDYVDINMSVEELADLITIAGLEVEGIDYIGDKGEIMGLGPVTNDGKRLTCQFLCQKYAEDSPVGSRSPVTWPKGVEQRRETHGIL